VDVVVSPTDPVEASRARIARWVRVANRVGYGALFLAIASFVVGVLADFPPWTVLASAAGLLAACVVLPVPIVVGYGLRAAAREDARRRRGGPT
jgi:hypothetical protein